MKKGLSLKVSQLNEAVIQKINNCFSDVKIEFTSIDPETIHMLSEFEGSALELNTDELLTVDEAVSLTNALDVLDKNIDEHRYVPIIVNLVSYQDCSTQFPFEILPLLQYTDYNLVFKKVDFRGSARYWQRGIGTFVEFENCIWDVESLEALQETEFLTAFFTVDDEPENNMCAIGGIRPGHRLEVCISDLTSAGAVRALASACDNGMVNVTPLSTKEISVDVFKALAVCRGVLELQADWLSDNHLASLCEFRADVLMLEEAVLDDKLLYYLSCSQVSEVSLEISYPACNNTLITAAMAKHLACYGERDGHGISTFCIDGTVRMTRRAKEILRKSIGESGEIEVTRARLMIRWGNRLS